MITNQLLKNYSVVSLNNLLNEISPTIPNPKNENKVKDHCNQKTSAMKPINGGPNRNPKKLILDTSAIAIPGGILLCFPAKLYTVGTQQATPNPTNINPKHAVTT